MRERVMKPLRELTLVRAVQTPVVCRDTDEGGPEVMELRFSPFGRWYEIDSWFEGRFLERTQRGAFAKTIRERGGQLKVMFNHGRDSMIGTKLLGVPTRVAEEDDSPVAEVELFDSSYVRDLLPGIRAGVYGSSFMFEVLSHEWVEEPGRSTHNPEGIPERTVTEVRLFEAGPVTWPANPDATAGVRSLTDDYYEALAATDPVGVQRMRAAVSNLRTDPKPPAADEAPVAEDPAATTPNEPAASHSGGLTQAQRRARLYPSLTRST